MPDISAAQIAVLLQNAMMAPSADNHHRVRFEWDGQCLQVYHERADWQPAGYPWVLDLLSLGALTETLVIASSTQGITATPVLQPDACHPQRILNIALQQQATSADPLSAYIPQRHTNRRIRFHGPKLDAASKNEITASVASQPNCALHWLDAPAERKQALRLMLQAETERFRSPALHHELFSAIRFDLGWHTAGETGLPPGALGVEPPLRALFAALRHWPLMRLVNRLGAHHLLGLRSCYLPCRLAPHLGMLTVEKTDMASVFAAGRAFQRLWLTATRLGYVIQPMPASALYALEPATGSAIRPQLQQDLAAGWQALDRGTPLMLFRLGKARALQIAAGRPHAVSISRTG